MRSPLISEAAGKVPLSVVSSATVAEELDEVGALFGASVTAIKNVSLALKLPSLAVTLMLIAPTFAGPGVPLKERVRALKFSQAGSAAPVLSEAL